MSQVSSSFPSYDNATTLSTSMATTRSTTNPRDHDGEWIDVSGIPEDATSEEPELACMLENLQKGRMGLSKGFRRGKKVSPVMF